MRPRPPFCLSSWHAHADLCASSLELASGAGSGDRTNPTQFCPVFPFPYAQQPPHL